MDIFEEATRNKYRFDCKGSALTEDLWDLPLTAKKDEPSIKGLHTTLNKQLKEIQDERTLCEDSIDDDPSLTRKTKEEKVLEIKIAIVKHIYKTLKQEQKKRAEAQDRKALKQKLLGKLAEQKDKKYDSMTPDEIQNIIDEIEAT